MKANQKTQPLTQRALFSMKRERLEAKILTYFKNTQDTVSVIEYLVVVMLRNAIVCSDFSFLCYDLVRELFITAKPNDALRKYCVYFKDYFSAEGEWTTVIGRLFSNKKEYQRFTEEARFYKKVLDTPKTGECKNPDLEIRLVSFFEDASEKKHTLTIRDADERVSMAKLAKSLEILTTLSIFKTKDGVRRFVKLVDFERPGTKDTLEKVMEELQIEEDQPSEEATETIEIVVLTGINPTTLSEEERLALVQVVHPEVVRLADARVVFTEQDKERSLLEDPTVDPLIEINDPPIKLESDSFAGDSTAVETTKSATTVAQKPKKHKRLSPKEAYVQSLIEKRQNKSPINSGNKKKNGGKKKKR